MQGSGIKSVALRAMLKAMLSPGVPTITIQKALSLSDAALFLDCREKTEYDVSHLPNAVWVGYSDFDFSRLTDISKTQTIIVYCSIGKRSHVITKKMMTAGYTNARNLVGGIFEWVNQGGSVYNGNQTTNDVHVYNAFWSRWLKKGNKIF